MRIADLKRAVEDVILKPEDNPVSDISKRSTIAALDLCQLGRVSETSGIEAQPQHGSAATLTSYSCSGDMMTSPSVRSASTCSTCMTTSSTPLPTQPPLSMSASLDTMVLRQSFSCRPSLGTSRRSSRVLQHLSHNKRKRSNSVSSCLNKDGMCTPGAVCEGGVSSTTTGGASAISLPPTARHTPFRFADLDETILTGIPSSSLPFPSTEPPSAADCQECGVTMLTSLDEGSNTHWSNAAIKEISETTHNPYDETVQTHHTGYSLGGEGIQRVSDSDAATLFLERQSSQPNIQQPFSFTAFRQPSNVCDLDELMDCD